VPAAAVIRVPQALSGIIGRKGCVGGYVSLALNLPAQPGTCVGNGMTLRTAGVSGTHGVAVKCVDIMGNTESEGKRLGRS
jgi:hypothetical protein